MRSSNALRAVIYSIGAAYLIFSQDHSVAVGMFVLQFVTAVLAVGGVVLYRIQKLKVSASDVVVYSAIALVTSLATFALGTQIQSDNTEALFVFKALVIGFALSMAILEFVLAIKSAPGDALEFRISATLGALTVLLFLIAPLNDLNAVGFFSAYLALSAVQRAVWAAGPNNRKKSVNGKK
jgi:hypothetical protein